MDIVQSLGYRYSGRIYRCVRTIFCLALFANSFWLCDISKEQIPEEWVAQAENNGLIYFFINILGKESNIVFNNFLSALSIGFAVIFNCVSGVAKFIQALKIKKKAYLVDRAVEYIEEMNAWFFLFLAASFLIYPVWLFSGSVF